MAENIPAPPPIHKRNQNRAPLSPSQEGLWFLQKFAPESSAYNVIYLFKLKGEVNHQILEQSLNGVILRHEILRTIYPTDKDGKPVQVVQPFEPLKLVYQDFSSRKANEKEQSIREYTIENGSRPFDLQNGPILKFALLHGGPEDDYLFFAIHHIAFDDWSRQIFIQDLLQLYGAYQSGQEPNLAALPIQYSDYALWQREWITGDTRSTVIQHWKSVLSGDLSVLALCTDHPRQVNQISRGLRYRFEISPSISAQIKEFCRCERLTTSAVFTAAYVLLLMHYTNQEDIIIGCPFANRPRSEQANLIGNFINTLPIRLNLENNPSVRELLSQVRTVMLDASAWKALPFDTLVGELAPQRELGRTPIYQAIINILNVPKRQRSVPGLEIDFFFREQMLADFDISLEISDTGDQINASVFYNMDLFDETTIHRMASHYQNILEQILARQDRPISELEMLSREERQHILIDWNSTALDYPSGKCIQQVFEEQVERVPDKPAVLFGGQQLTYRGLNQRSNQIAHFLRKLGAGPDLPIGLYLERSADLVVTILGILKAGSPYVPLDSIYPKDRRAEIIHDSGMNILVTQNGFITDEFEQDLLLVSLDGQQDLISSESEQNPSWLNKPEDLVYILYTSGTSGKPKGVEITHRSLLNSLLSTNQRAGLSSNDMTIVVAASVFDQSVFDFLAPLCSGATVVVASREEVYDSNLLIKKVMELPITWMDATPATWQMLREAGWQGKPGLKILCGGEAFPPELAEWLMKTCGEVYNLYGPTEATIQCTCARLVPGYPVTVGRPIANTKLYILDSHRKPVPPGVVGELYIGGEGLARGYHNRPDLTADKFIPDPFSTEPGMRLYTSGDRACYQENGEIVLLGRIDHQVKIRGYRIELGEIETAIGQCPGIQQAFAGLWGEQPGDQRLVAYLVMAPGMMLDEDKLRGFLREKIPAYMIPTAFVQLDAVPLNVNGKIDRKALPAPGTTVSGTYSPPFIDLQAKLAEIWENMLNIPKIGLDDDFFDIGGNSLMAVRLTAIIENEMKQRLPVVELFRSSTIRKLAQFIHSTRTDTPAWTPLVEIQPEGAGKPLFIIYNQFFARYFANEIGPVWPIYGLKVEGLEVETEFDTTIEQMAARYLEAIKVVQPSGPYRLVGFCVGGLAAYEMACRLEEQGERVSLLVEMDTFAHKYLKHSWSHWIVAIAENIPFWIKLSFGWWLPQQLLRLVKNLLKYDLFKKNPDTSQPSSGHETDNPYIRDVEDAHKKRKQKFHLIIDHAQDIYQFRPYAGRITVFSAKWKKPSRILRGPVDPTLGWGELARAGVDTYSFKGDHQSIYQPPYATALAATLKDILLKLDEEERNAPGKSNN